MGEISHVFIGGDQLWQIALPMPPNDPNVTIDVQQLCFAKHVVNQYVDFEEALKFVLSWCDLYDEFDNHLPDGWSYIWDAVIAQAGETALKSALLACSNEDQFSSTAFVMKIHAHYRCFDVINAVFF